jgi:hypothetical protein
MRLSLIRKQNPGFLRKKYAKRIALKTAAAFLLTLF